MSNQIPTPTASTLNAMFPNIAISFERTVITEQLRKLGIEFTMNHRGKHFIIDIPTNADGILRITPTEDDGINSEFFKVSPLKQVRLPGGRMIKTEASEIVLATVEFISHGEHPDVTYLLKEPNFAEVIDTAIESLSQIDGIYLSVIQKQRPQRRNHPQQPELGQE